MNTLIEHLDVALADMRSAGFYKPERVLISKQGGTVETEEDGRLLNLCSNNYLGLASNPELIESAVEAIRRFGYGLASVRFICGTQSIHKRLERRISDFLGTEDSVLYPSCFDANTGLFETILDENDAVISDTLNHASIIDGIRLCKARRYQYVNNDMDELERCLIAASGARFRLIATDGVFSMDGVIANLRDICDLADQHNAIVLVDDSHAVGVLGENGQGSIEYCGVQGRVDIITGTFGKALGGASGGYTSGNRTIMEWLRQRSRPYLFSNTLAPVIAATSMKALELVEDGAPLRRRLFENTHRFRSAMSDCGFELGGADHPIVPVMLGEAALAEKMSARLLKRGINAIGFSFPVVPHGKARIRTQISAAHSPQEIDTAVAVFSDIGRELGII